MSELDVLFVAAAGPRLGFGHLIRCGVLADALGTARRAVLEASASTRETARDLGWTLSGTWRRALDDRCPDLVIVDHPSRPRTAVAVRSARRARIPVAVIHDGGSLTDRADLTIDGAISRPPTSRHADLEGPPFAILAPAVGRLRRERPARHAARVLIALGGGAAGRSLGPALAGRIRDRAPWVEVDVAAGFEAGPLPPLPPGCHWLQARRGLADPLARTTLAVVAGGVSLYEACALGTPTVALPVVSAQAPAIRVFGARGAIVAVLATRRAEQLQRVAAAVAGLLCDDDRREALGQRAAALVDGRGVDRVASRLKGLVQRARELGDVA